MENYLMSSPTQLSHVYLGSENCKPNMEEQYAVPFSNAAGPQANGRAEPPDNQSSHSTPVHGVMHTNHGNVLGKSHLEVRLSPPVYEDLDFASDLPDFSYDQTISLDLDEEKLASHSMIGRTGHSKTFSFDGGALQMPFSLNSGSRFSTFSHSRNVSLDDSNYSRADVPEDLSAPEYVGGHSHSASMGYGAAHPPSGHFSHSVSNSTLHSIDSVPQLSSSMSNKSLQESPYSMVNVYPSNSASTPGRRRLSTSLSTSNLYATPLRGSAMHSPPVKVGKTPLKSHHARSRSKTSMAIEAGSSQLLASIANMKNFSASATNLSASATNLSAPSSAVAPSSMKVPALPYHVPHSAPVHQSGTSNPFETSFISPKIDMNLSDLNATPLATPAKSFPSSLGQNFTPIPHNHSFGGSLNETNLSQIGRDPAVESHLGRLGQDDIAFDQKVIKPVDSIKIEDQDDDACKQLKRAKSHVAFQDMQRASLGRAPSARSLKATPYSQQASIDLLSPDMLGSDHHEFRTGLKSYPASIDLAAITKSKHHANHSYPPPHSYSNYSPEREYDKHEAPERLLPPMAASLARSRTRKQSVSNSQAYPTHSQIHETSTTEEIAKFAEKIMNSDQKRPIVVQEDSDEVHDPKKKHKCPLCLARFQRPEHVKRHLKCHSSEKPYVCDMEDCDRRFNRKDNLKAHLKKIHGKMV